MILFIDNYDSFVHNLARYFERLGQPTCVRRNDAVTCDEIAELRPTTIVLSPGPCTPTEAGVCLEVVRQFWNRTPILGVCLGHQTIAAAFGGEVVRATPMHGRASPVRHSGHPLFAGVPNPFSACRYHSLAVSPDRLPECLDVIARCDDGVIMAIAHREAPVIGVQFHPESILTECGFTLLANYLTWIGHSVASVDWYARERVPPPPPRELPAFTTPVTF